MMAAPREPHLKHNSLAGKNSGRGVALIEFALILPVLIIMAMATIDFGRLIQTRLIISNVSREGGSIAGRQSIIDGTLVSMLQASGKPLDLTGPDGKVIVTRINAGTSAGASNPTIESQQSGGGLGASSSIGAGNPNLGLTSEIYNHLVFKTANSTSDITEVTVVEVFFKYRPITPLPAFISGMLKTDGNGMIIGSKAIF